MSDAELQAEMRREEQRKEQGARDGPRPNPSDGQEDESDDGPSVAATMDGPSNKRGDLSDMDVYWFGGHEYAVWSDRSGQNAYRVDLNELTCTCVGGEYNTDTEACRHIQKVITVGPSKISFDRLVFQDLVELHERANDYLLKANDALGAMRSAQEAYESDVAAGNNPGAAKPADSDPDTPGGEQAKAEEAAERLKAAFDEHIDHMNVKAKEGLVWFQTGKETPDEWPYPGFSETFKAVTSPDCVAYVHDGTAEWADSPHKWHDKKPSKWFKNALEPGDVDEYIEELGL